MDTYGGVSLFLVVIFSYVTIKYLVFRRARKAEERRDREQTGNVRPENTIRQTYIISPVYTIDANREPLPYEAALAMPRTTRSTTEITNKSYDDDLPSYDQAIIQSKPIETVYDVAPTVPIPVANSAGR